MEPLNFLQDLLIVFGVAGAAVFIFHRLRLPTVVGLLVAGMIAGPTGLSLIQDAERVAVLADVGVVVLLFAVGLEFSLPRLVGLGKMMVWVGVPQVLICLLTGIAATWWYFDDVRRAILVGMLLAMSSTAVVFKLLSDRHELTSPQGNIAAAVLLFQDLLVVVCMVSLPLLAAQPGDGNSLWTTFGQGFGGVFLLLVVGRYLVPFLLRQVLRTHSRELFLIVLVLLCLGSSALTAAMGWSLALGAFLAGLALSESEYATQTLAEVLPFRDTLSSLFFISVGMLLDLRLLATNIPLVAATVLAVVTLKIAAGGLPTLVAGYPLRIAVLTGVALAQVGEFSFILAERGMALGLLDREQYQTFLSAAVLTITLTPMLMAGGPRFAEWVSHMPVAPWWHSIAGAPTEPEPQLAMRNHVVIVGYGLNGRNLARVLRVSAIEYAVLELNPQTVRQARWQGEPIFYGDCTRQAVLEHLGVNTARILVIAISDPASTRRAVELARRMRPQLHIIVRTRYLSEVEQLRQLGADVIIPEEFETSVQIFAEVLREFDIPRNRILDMIEGVRRDHYEVLRDIDTSAAQVRLSHAVFEKMVIESCQIRKGSVIEGKSVGELQLRTTTGATLVAVRRNGQLLLNPGPDLRFQADDIAMLIGDRTQIDRAVCFLDPEA